MGQTFTVSSRSELYDAIENASGGDRIELEPGDYARLQITNTNFGGEGLTIVSADPDDMAVFDKIGVYQSDNIHFESVEIDYEPTGNTGYSIGFRAVLSDDISLRSSVLVGGYDEDLSDPLKAAAPSGQAVSVRWGDNIVIEDNDISEFHRGIGVSYIENLKVNGNEVYDIRTTPLAGGALNDVEIVGNHFGSSAPVGLGGSGDHGDMIHFYPLSKQDGPMKNIVIQDNFFEQGTNPSPILGIYLDDNGAGGSGLGYEDVVIENNIIHNGDAQGLRAENVNGLTVIDNTFLQSSGEGIGEAPGIIMNRGTENVVIENNVIAGLISGSSVSVTTAEELNIVIGDNLFVQDRDPNADDYVGNLFVNALTPNGDPNDFIPLQGTAAEGYGAHLSVLSLDDGEHVSIISTERGDHLDTRTITFDAEALYGSDGAIDFAASDLTWDFGDGTTASGDNISHTYEDAGTYNVTATFTLDDGEVISTDKTVDVFTPDAAILDFEDGFVDASDIENQIKVVGDVSLEASRFGDAMRLETEKSRVEIDRSEEIIDNPEFSISFAFQKDGGTPENGDDGYLVYFSGTAFISTEDGRIALGGTTSTGDSIRLRVNTDDIEDGGWHHLTYTFSSEDGTAIMYLDGEEVDREDGLTGIQKSTGGHDLHIGGRVDDGFGGLIDEVEFTRAALSADEVRDRYETLFDETVEVAPQEEAPVDVVEAPVDATDDTAEQEAEAEATAEQEVPQDAEIVVPVEVVSGKIILSDAKQELIEQDETPAGAVVPPVVSTDQVTGQAPAPVAEPEDQQETAALTSASVEDDPGEEIRNIFSLADAKQDVQSGDDMEGINVFSADAVPFAPTVKDAVIEPEETIAPANAFSTDEVAFAPTVKDAVIEQSDTASTSNVFSTDEIVLTPGAEKVAEVIGQWFSLHQRQPETEAYEESVMSEKMLSLFDIIPSTGELDEHVPSFDEIEESTSYEETDHFIF